MKTEAPIPGNPNPCPCIIDNLRCRVQSEEKRAVQTREGLRLVTYVCANGHPWTRTEPAPARQT